jgi:outer membrane protein TolC
MQRRFFMTASFLGRLRWTGWLAGVALLSFSWPPVVCSQERPSGGSDVYLPLSLRAAIESALADSSVVRVLDGGVNLAAITPTDVEIARRRVDQELGEFQPRLSAGFDGSQIDQPPNAFFGPGIAANTRRDTANASARITQPLPSGGTLSAGFEPPTAYLYFPDGVNPGEFNPIYSTDYVIRVSQPVLRSAGRKVTLAPVRIARVRSQQVQWELEDALNARIRSVEAGYWQLYAAHVQVETLKEIVGLAEESVRVETLRQQADRSIPADVARAQVQLDGLLRSRSVLNGTVRRRVLQLRQLMGGPPVVEPLLLPSERPVEAPPPEDPAVLTQTALASRPSLNLLRARLSERRIALGVAENATLPSLDLRAEYWMNGLAERLDDSLRQTRTSDYTDWTLGLGFSMPLGNAVARNRLRIAELELVREHQRIVATEQQIAFEIAELLSDLQVVWQRMEIAREQTRASREWLRVSRIRYTQPPASRSSADWLLLALTDLQSAMRATFDAMTELSDATAEYNTLLARLREAQGLSVYEWQHSHPTQPLPGGHSGIAWRSYRMDPQLAPWPGVPPAAALAAGRQAAMPRVRNPGSESLPVGGHSMFAAERQSSLRTGANH